MNIPNANDMRITAIIRAPEKLAEDIESLQRWTSCQIRDAAANGATKVAIGLLGHSKAAVQSVKEELLSLGYNLRMEDTMIMIVSW